MIATIELKRALLDAIGAQAAHSYPRECCGLLVGREDRDGPGGHVTVTRLVPSENLATGGGRDRFEVDPKVRFDVMRELDGGEERIVGHYHSHPDHPPEPSATDIEMAFEPEFVWLITSVSANAVGATRAWRLNRDAGSVLNVEISVEA